MRKTHLEFLLNSREIETILSSFVVETEKEESVIIQEDLSNAPDYLKDRVIIMSINGLKRGKLYKFEGVLTFENPIIGGEDTVFKIDVILSDWYCLFPFSFEILFSDLWLMAREAMRKNYSRILFNIEIEKQVSVGVECDFENTVKDFLIKT